MTGTNYKAVGVTCGRPFVTACVAVATAGASPRPTEYVFDAAVGDNARIVRLDAAMCHHRAARRAAMGSRPTGVRF